MDYKKKYKDALSVAKTYHDCNDGKLLTANVVGLTEAIFPELKESEDEKIRKTLLESFEYQIKESYPDKEWHCGVKLKEVLVWLEKQGEQKPAWSEEDEEMVNNIIDTVNDSIQYCDVDDIGTKARFALEKEVAWLKSLKERYTWKPSDEQIIELHRAISGCSYNIEPLIEIEEHLKKLREE